jgi:small lipoprotein (TIGR04452 family)
MLKFFINIFIILFFINCPLTNLFFTKISRVRGTEAKQILKERLASFYIKDISDGNTEALVGDFLMPNLARIEDDGIYSRRDVESCATKIFLAGLAIDEPNITYNRNKKASEPLKPSDPNSRVLPPLLCSLPNYKGKLIDLD